MRLFIAIDTSKEIQDYLFCIQKKINNAKLVDSYHITLKFLGDVKNKDEIIEKLKNVKFKNFYLTISKLGVFPNKNYIRVIWAGLKECKELIELQKNIEIALSPFKFKKDFKFHPHITLARVSFIKNKLKFIEELEKINIEEKTFYVEKFILYESILTQKGPIYNKVMEFNQ